ncbi:MAG: tRNA pseudouridine(38-40) synthase TruA [Bacteriovoracia bacterium]
MKYALLLSYLGTRYCGWQRQKGSAAEGDPSLQETIEKALSQITQEKISCVASGRTDAGVHACGQVAHFRLTRDDWKRENIQNGLNSLLPDAIRVLAIREVPEDFHAQLSAERKQYSFYFQQGPCELPHVARTSWWIRKRLDWEAMHEAVGALVGEHDFVPFQAAGANVKTTVRTIFEARVAPEPIGFPDLQASQALGYGMVRLTLVGSGFLKQMVRGIAGTLLQVGEGKRPATCMREILEKKDRSLVGATAQPRGLWLEKVWYRDVAF